MADESSELSVTFTRVNLVSRAPESDDYQTSKNNCILTLMTGMNRVKHYRNSFHELQLNPNDFVIVLIHADDFHGGQIIKSICQNSGDFSEKTSTPGKIKYFSGILGRPGLDDLLAIFDEDAAEKLKQTDGLAAVVIDYGVAEIYNSSMIEAAEHLQNAGQA